MNSIKSNPFVSTLVAITVVVCGALFFLASSGGGRYDKAKAEFDDSYASVSASEGIPLYPTDANRAGKHKALTEYRQSITELSALFDKYRPGSLENVKPQVFMDGLVKANKEITEAVESAKCELPENFFLGFEFYSKEMAKEEATGALGFQLEGISHALRGLAEARPSKLIRIHRVPVPEESGGTYQRTPNDVARNFAVEVTFKGSEPAARKFISYLGETDSHYYVVRCVKIVNESDAPPKVSDAQFEDEKAPAAAAPGGAADPFAFFTDTPVEGAPVVGAPVVGAPVVGAPVVGAPVVGAPVVGAPVVGAPVEGAPVVGAPVEGDAPPAPPAEEAVDSSRILAQVLGNEEIVVFVRFDISMFLPSKELPKP